MKIIGVPESSEIFLDFLDKVHATGCLDQSAPVILHCSAGIGRSGTFAVVDSIIAMVTN